MSVMVAGTWVGPRLPSVAEVAQAWVACSQRPYSWLKGDPYAQIEAHLRELWQQIVRLNQEGTAEPLLVVPGSLADPIGAGQTWADLSHAWELPVLLTLPRRAAMSQAIAFAALLRQSRARCLGWVLLGEPEFAPTIATDEVSECQLDSPPSLPPEAWDELDSTLAACLEAQVGIPVLGRVDPQQQVNWDQDALAMMGYV
ncbi:MAG: hypothetical protein Q6K80_09150 [Thermostichus sp. DG_1_6_bins_120]